MLLQPAYSGMLATKTALPVLKEALVPRERLIHSLNGALSRKLTFISAPAGYGKSTLISQWVHQCGAQAAWVSLDENDNDIVRFWRYVIQALCQDADGAFADRAAQLIRQMPGMSVNLAVDALINELHRTSAEIVLVLDDVHLITNPAIHSSLSYFIDNMPGNVHLLLSSRVDPPFPTVKWLAQGDAVRLAARDLEFNAAEIGAFYRNAAQVELSKRQLQILSSKLEGWAAGLQLVSLTLPFEDELDRFISDLNSSHLHIRDFLFEEVFNRLSADEQEFTTQTSVLPQMNASACNAVTGRSDGQSMLERLQANNLFLIPLDAHRAWYRYHHLFADFLQNLMKKRDAEGWKRCHRKAGVWAAERGAMEQAAQHAFAAGDFGLAEQRIRDQIQGKVEQGEFSTLTRWFDQFPDEFPLSSDMRLLRAFIQVVTGQTEQAEAELDKMERRELPAAQGEEAEKLRSGLLFIRSNLLFTSGSFDKWFAFRSGIPEDDILTPEPIFYNFNYNQSKPFVRLTDLGLRGGLSEDMERIGHLFTGVLQSHGWQDSLIHLYVVQSLCEGYYEWNRLEDSETLIHRLESISRVGEIPGLFVPNRMTQALVHAARGQWAAAQDTIGDALDHLPNTADPHWRRYLWAMRARLYVMEGKAREAKKSLADLSISAKDKPSFNRYFEYATLAKVLGAQKKEPEALRILEQLLPLSRRENCVMATAEILCLQAVFSHAAGYLKQARRFLHDALEIGEANGYVRCFTDAGPTMDRLLRQYAAFQPQAVEPSRIARKAISGAYIAALLASFSQADPGAARPENARSHANPPESFTSGELEILRLVRQGASNKEIAGALSLSEGTIKVYLSRLYGKLGVSSRTQALLAAEALDLLEE
ncbi:hypothetical protein J25TS5_45610 [Paenibacillus faecis]|uniref:LuxR C-terminal-related transcriptional regulator n=1 Tax=Paenibacillus faecis TaxID=862114 RepID=UPI001B1A15B3|nr:LuxR C-terminal-related transcriptional regulator [Paenibacillus faecis]GIO87629.1 hypothetical protein J25TS5_45610 [Paenibacillus faecis]